MRHNISRTRASFSLGYVATHGEIFCISVQATNDALLTSPRVSSDCTTIDTTPPTAQHVGIGLSASAYVDFQPYRDCVFANAHFVDDIAYVARVEWCISSLPDGACDVRHTASRSFDLTAGPCLPACLACPACLPCLAC